jgi:hypothetical protein
MRDTNSVYVYDFVVSQESKICHLFSFKLHEIARGYK